MLSQTAPWSTGEKVGRRLTGTQMHRREEIDLPWVMLGGAGRRSAMAGSMGLKETGRTGDENEEDWPNACERMGEGGSTGGVPTASLPLLLLLLLWEEVGGT